MPTVLFVCTANVCRSPMASVLFRQIANQVYADPNWQVESAGTWAIDGALASEGAQQVMSKRGFDLSNHRSRIVKRELLQAVDLVLTMERGHKEALRIEFPGFASRIYMLSEMIDQVRDIQDPIGGPLSEYEFTAQEIERILTQGYEKIKRLSRREVV
jgi:protein-tyrosine-phosphatase